MYLRFPIFTANPKEILYLCKDSTIVDPTATIFLVEENCDFDSDMDTE